MHTANPNDISSYKACLLPSLCISSFEISVFYGLCQEQIIPDQVFPGLYLLRHDLELQIHAQKF